MPGVRFRTLGGPRRSAADMPRDGAIIFRAIAGKLDVLTVECDKDGRRGRYPSAATSGGGAAYRQTTTGMVL